MGHLIDCKMLKKKSRLDGVGLIRKILGGAYAGPKMRARAQIVLAHKFSLDSGEVIA
jgi:hypothetical protein